MAGGQLIAGAQRGSIFYVDPFKVVIVGLDCPIEEAPDLYDGKRLAMALDEDMIESIVRYGVQEAIKVAVRNDVVYIYNGRTRVRHAREVVRRQIEAGDKDAKIVVPAMGEKMKDTGRLADLSIILNTHHFSDSPLVEAEKMQSALDRTRDIKRVAMMFRVSIATVQNRIALLALSAPVREAVESEKITPTAALQLAKLSDRDQAAAVELAAESGASVTKMRRAANPSAPVKPSRKAALAAIEAMKGTPWADGAMYVLGLTTDVPDAVAALVGVEIQEAAQ